MLWAEHVTRNTARVRDDVHKEVQRYFNDAELVELTGVCGQFAMANRMHSSLRLPGEAPGDVNKIKTSIRSDPLRLKHYIEHMIELWPQDFPSPRRGSTVAPRTCTPQDASAPAQPPRVPLLYPQNAPKDSAQFLHAAQQLLGGLPNWVRALAHLPHVAKMLLPFYMVQEREGAGGILPANLRMLALLRTSHINTASYALAHYTALGLCAGLSDEQIAALSTDRCGEAYCFSPRERAALSWAEQVALNTAQRREDAYAMIKQHFDDTEIVELTALCGICNAMNRIQNALRVPIESAAEVAALNRSVAIEPSRIKTYLESVLSDWPQALPLPAAT